VHDLGKLERSKCEGSADCTWTYVLPHTIISGASSCRQLRVNDPATSNIELFVIAHHEGMIATNATMHPCTNQADARYFWKQVNLPSPLILSPVAPSLVFAPCHTNAEVAARIVQLPRTSNHR
jgi:hypothetical protein